MNYYNSIKSQSLRKSGRLFHRVEVIPDEENESQSLRKSGRLFLRKEKENEN